MKKVHKMIQIQDTLEFLYCKYKILYQRYFLKKYHDTRYISSILDENRKYLYFKHYPSLAEANM